MSSFTEDWGYKHSGIIEPWTIFDLNTNTRQPIKDGERAEF